MKRSEAELAFVKAWELFGIEGSDLEEEYRFHSTRKWRLDFAWPSQKLGVEIDGRGRHQTVKGVKDDCEKRNAAVVMGWRILVFPATDRKRAHDWVITCVEALCCKD